MADASELYSFMESVLVPELTKRNELVYGAREAGKPVSEALSGFDRIAVIINSSVDFFESAYNEQADMSEFLETVFEKGMEHKIHFFMGVSPREYDECSEYGAFAKAISLKTGIHLGGEAWQQRIFDLSDLGDFDRKTPAGSALILSGGKAVEIMTAKVD